IGGAIAGKAEQKALDASLTRLAAVEVVAGGAAKSSDLTALQSTVGNNKATADNQIATLADADKAMATRVDNLTTTVNTDRTTAQAGIKEAKTIASDAKASTAQLFNNLTARLDPRGDIGGAIAGKADQQDLEASLTRLSAVEVAANGTAKSSDLAALQSTVGGNKAAADKQMATLADADKALGLRIDNVTAAANTDRAAAQAGINEAKTAAADAKQSGAQSIDKLTARLDPKGDIGGAIAGKAEQKALDASLTRLAAVEV
ncbi:hypothetical protein AA0N74_23525, partial [Chromobacterium vaccinii]|uniref:hypothetical protein n=1 Tax=Chromobacterium vaccinii TaxID=1108595 RepID=UPI0031D82A05